MPKVKLGAGTLKHKARSLLAAASGRARCKHVQRRLPGRGARARPGGDGQPGAPTAASTAVQPGLRVTTVPRPRQLEKWEVRLGKLGWLTWCSLGITTHTPQARAPKFILCPQAYTFYFGVISANAFLPQFRARVCAARRRLLLRLFIINDAASPHHYDNYYYCCDFGLRGESCRRRGSQRSGCRAAVQPQRSRRCPCFARGYGGRRSEPGD